MRLITSSQIREIEAKAVKSGISEETLMEAAGCQAAKWIQKKIPELSSKSIALVIGPGHNGADGLVVARELAPTAKKLVLFLEDSTRPLWIKQRKKLQGLDIQFRSLQDFTGSFDVLIDALYGVGLNRELGPSDQALIQKINQSPMIISLDIPSGLDSDRGIVWGESVHANHTLTFNLAKPGLFVNDGPLCAGKIHVLDIGLKDLNFLANSHFTVSRQWIRNHKPRFNEKIHKSNRGRSLLIAGSTEFPGAGILAARAALRTGSGYVALATNQMDFPSWQNPDFIVSVFDSGILTTQKFDALGIGPGLGTTASVSNLIQQLKKLKIENVIVDADAITVCTRENLFPLPASWVATPHAGELARVLNIDSKTIEADRFHYARAGQKKMGCQVLLKGFHSIFATVDQLIVIPTGNSALAKSGTGDVLTGMITALVAQGMTPIHAALFGSYLHGWIADRWVAKGRDPASLMASDLIEALPRALAVMGLQ